MLMINSEITLKLAKKSFAVELGQQGFGNDKDLVVHAYRTAFRPQPDRYRGQCRRRLPGLR